MAAIQDTIARVAAENGVDPSFALAVASRESIFNPNAKASKTIRGLFQMSGPLRDKYGVGNSTDPAVQTVGWVRFINDTRKQMRAELGRDPTDGELYLGHYWGPDRASRVIAGAQAGLSPRDVFTPRELAANPALGRADTVGQLAQRITGDIDRRKAKYGGAGQDFSAFGQPDDEDGALERNFERNKAWTKQGAANFNTDLGDQEPQFRQWLKDNNVPFDPDGKGPSDYDMRGFWQALQANDPKAKQAIDPNDQRMHYPDYWKTPYHETFSNESRWADPKTAPAWNDKDQLVAPDGKVLFDDRAGPQQQPEQQQQQQQQDDGGGAAMSSAPQKGMDFAAFGQQPGQDASQSSASSEAGNGDAHGKGGIDFAAFGKALATAFKSPNDLTASADEDSQAQQQDAMAGETAAMLQRPGSDIDAAQFQVAGIPTMPTSKPVMPVFASLGQAQPSAYVPIAPSDDQADNAQAAFLTQQPQQQPLPDQQQFTS
jgi:hypothetical protein